MKIEYKTRFEKGDFVMPLSSEICHWTDDRGQYHPTGDFAPLELDRPLRVEEVLLVCCEPNKFHPEGVVEKLILPYGARRHPRLRRVLGIPLLSGLEAAYCALETGLHGVKTHFGEPRYFGPRRKGIPWLFEVVIRERVLFGTFYARDFTLAPDSEELKKQQIIVFQ